MRSEYEIRELRDEFIEIAKITADTDEDMFIDIMSKISVLSWVLSQPEDKELAEEFCGAIWKIRSLKPTKVESFK